MNRVVELRRDRLERPAEAGSDDSQHLVAIDEAAHLLERFGFERLVVVADHLDWQAADATLGVDFLDRDVDRGLGALAPFGALAGERYQAPDLDGSAFQFRGLRAWQTGEQRGGDACSHEHNPPFHWHVPPTVMN